MRLWEMIERHGITTFGVSPTAIRMLSKSAGELPPMDSLRLLGSTGEPWDEASWLWFFERVGRRRCPIINISGGTEIVGSFLFPLPIQPLKPCTLGGPAPGMATEVVDENGAPVRGRKGYLVCTGPAPSMTRGIWNDPERYLETYWSRFPGMWYHGDWASVDEDGHWFLHGRADESMNVAGRKVGPAEVEEAMMQHPGVAEAAVIGVPDELKGEAIVGYAVAKPGAAVDPAAVCAHRGGGARADLPAARRSWWSAELPKTQSGKIVRRLIRQKYLGEALGDFRRWRIRGRCKERSTIEPATVRTPWHQFRAFLARRIRYKITRGGVLFTFAILLVAVGAIVSANNLLFLIVAAMMATLLVSGLVSRLCLAGLELDFQVPEHIPAGRSVPGASLRAQSQVVPAVVLHPRGSHSRGRQPHHEIGRLLSPDRRRRHARRGGRRALSTARRIPPERLRLLHVVPVRLPGEDRARHPHARNDRLPRRSIRSPGFDDLLAGIAGEIESHYRGLGRDFYRIRPYEAFESARHVDWKASAHVGSLQIREFAREQEQTVEIFLDRDVPHELDAWFEHAVNCCAFLAWRLSTQGASIHFRSNGYEFRQPEDGDIYTILKYLALVYPQTGRRTGGASE